MATTMPVMTNLCDCSTNGLKFWSPCVPQIGAGCIQTYKCAVNGSYDPSGHIIGCSSFDSVAIERRIQNQSRMPTSQFQDALQDVTISQGILSFKGSPENFVSMSSRVWGNPNYLRNQSDRSTPARSGAWTGYDDRNHAFGMSVGGAKINISGYVNVPTRGNSTRSTITGNRPGAMTPGGQGVDVKHGSYDRYLSKKKGAILTKPKVTVTQSQPLPLLGYRRGFNDGYKPRVYDSAGINNMSYKFTPVSLSYNCNKCNGWYQYGSLGNLIAASIPWQNNGLSWSVLLVANNTTISTTSVKFPPPGLNALTFYLTDQTVSNNIKKFKNTSTAIIVILSDPKLGQPADGWKWVILRPGSPNTLLNNNNIGMWSYSETVDPAGSNQSRITLFSQPPLTINSLSNLETPIQTVSVSKGNDDIYINIGDKMWIYEYNLNTIY